MFFASSYVPYKNLFKKNANGYISNTEKEPNMLSLLHIQWNTLAWNRGTTWYHVVPLKKIFFFFFLFFIIETIKANKTLIFVRENVGALLKSI